MHLLTAFSTSTSLLPVYLKYDADGNGIMSKEEFRDYFREVMGKNLTDEEADDAYTGLVGDSESITLNVFQEGILKSNKNKSFGLPSELLIEKCHSYSHSPNTHNDTAVWTLPL